jgi:hypothetical protein
VKTLPSGLTLGSRCLDGLRQEGTEVLGTEIIINGLLALLVVGLPLVVGGELRGAVQRTQGMLHGNCGLAQRGLSHAEQCPQSGHVCRVAYHCSCLLS